jgi:beta-N-acetylhexosaminidase
MTSTHRASPTTLLRPLAAVLAVSVVVAGCLSGSPASPPTSSTWLATAVTPVQASTAARTATAATASFVQVATPSASSTATPAAAPDIQAASPTLAQLVGQKLVIRMEGTTPSASLLGRIRRGEVGGVILFGDNIVNATQLKALTSALHNAAKAGGQPRLLVMTDQEGGLVRRITWAAPTMSARTMASGGPTYTRSKGKLAGAALRSLGVDVDLAPVGDVPSSTSSFMWLAQRTFGFTTSSVTTNANAFALGLRDGGELATMKHFPGIGRATQNTDNFVVSIPAGLGALESADLVPYTTAIANGIPIIMLSNADYPILDPLKGAGWSYAIVHDLLRAQMGFRGVTITDSLTAAAHTRGIGPSTLAIQAAAAGTDFILVDSLESATATVYSKLLSAAKSGSIPLSRLQASYRRIAALKATP